MYLTCSVELCSRQKEITIHKVTMKYKYDQRSCMKTLFKDHYTNVSINIIELLFKENNRMKYNIFFVICMLEEIIIAVFKCLF